MTPSTRTALPSYPSSAPSQSAASAAGVLRHSKSVGDNLNGRPSDESSLTAPTLTDAEFPHDYHGISLTCFAHVSILSVLAPLEESSRFRSTLHQRRYKLLKTALRCAIKDVEEMNLADTLTAPEHWKDAQEVAAQAFHTEFTARLQWGRDDTAEFTASQKPDSVFPSINTFIKERPKVSIAWTVQSFYNQQEKNFEELKLLQEMKHQWELGELHYLFWRTSSGLRNSVLPKMKMPTPVWYTLLGGSKSRIPLLAQSPVTPTYDELESWTPMHDRQRRLAQFEALKQIRTHLHRLGMPFPIHFCPGGMSLVEYFSIDGFPKIPETDEEMRHVFGRRETWRHWKDRLWMMRVQTEGGELLDCDTPEDYFQSHLKTPASRLSSPGELAEGSRTGIEDSSSGDAPGDLRQPRGSGSNIRISMSNPNEVRKEGWFSDWKNPKAGWPLALRA